MTDIVNQSTEVIAKDILIAAINAKLVSARFNDDNPEAIAKAWNQIYDAVEAKRRR